MQENPFWTFSIALYAREDVADTCLRLQDEYGLNINLVLYSGFLAGRGKALDASTLIFIRAALAPWQTTVVNRLRDVRCAQKRYLSKLPANPELRTAGSRWYELLKDVELQAERLEQDWLWVYARDHESSFQQIGEALPGLFLTEHLPTERRRGAIELLQCLWNIIGR